MFHDPYPLPFPPSTRRPNLALPTFLPLEAAEEVFPPCPRLICLWWAFTVSPVIFLLCLTTSTFSALCQGNTLTSPFLNRIFLNLLNAPFELLTYFSSLLIKLLWKNCLEFTVLNSSWHIRGSACCNVVHPWQLTSAHVQTSARPPLWPPPGIFQTPKCLGRTCLPPLPDTCSFFFKYLHGILQCWKFLCISHPMPHCDLKWPKRTCDLKQRYLACACLMDGSINMYTADCQIYTYPSSFNGFLKYTFKNVLNI